MWPSNVFKSSLMLIIFFFKKASEFFWLHYGWMSWGGCNAINKAYIWHNSSWVCCRVRDCWHHLSYCSQCILNAFRIDTEMVPLMPARFYIVLQTKHQDYRHRVTLSFVYLTLRLKLDFYTQQNLFPFTFNLVMPAWLLPSCGTEEIWIGDYIVLCVGLLRDGEIG